MADLICYSGGADGADLAWGDVARLYGYRVAHLSFPGHKTSARQDDLVPLSNEQLRDANKRLAIAAPRIERVWPPRHDYVRKLLQRNWWQVNRTQAVYAVGVLDPQLQLVAGGTAWAIQMYLDTRWQSHAELYLFEQELGHWFQWVDGGWRVIERPPSPPAHFTGIGTRRLNDAGKLAIKTVFD